MVWEEHNPVFKFVADDCDIGVFYLFKDWVDIVLDGASTEDYKRNQPRLCYLSKNEHFITEDGGNSPVYIPTNELIYSSSINVRRGALEQQGLNATTALLTLAAAGVDIALPNISFSCSAEEIQEIRCKPEEERVTYLRAIAEMADQSFSRLKSGDFRDIYKWQRMKPY